MNKIIDYLKQLELSDTEAKLYLTLLKTGPLSVRDLAETIEMKRTTAYLYIDQLIEKGLVMKIVKGSEKLIAANSPDDSLEHLVKKKLDEANIIQHEFPTMMTTINSIPQDSNVSETDIAYYKGINNVWKIYEEAFSSNELRSYAKVEEPPKLSTDNPGLFSNAFKKNSDMKVWEIVYDSAFSRRQAMKILSQHNNYFYKFMPPDLKWSITAEDILIFNNKVAIINYKGKVSSIVLHSVDFYNNSKELFNFIWKILPEEK